LWPTTPEEIFFHALMALSHFEKSRVGFHTASTLCGHTVGCRSNVGLRQQRTPARPRNRSVTGRHSDTLIGIAIGRVQAQYPMGAMLDGAK
jgi:hypothetical protein